MTQAAPVSTAASREYETIYVLRPDVDREGAERVSGRVADVVSREGGKLTRVESWGRRRLAYDVKKYKRGVYVYLRYLGQGAVVSELERNLRMADEILKFQTVKLRDDVDVAGVAVAEEDVKFEHVEPAEDEEADESWARTLGLEESSEEETSGERRESSDSDEGGASAASSREGDDAGKSQAADKGEADKGEADKGEADKAQADKGEADKAQADKAQADKGEADKAQAGEPAKAPAKGDSSEEEEEEECKPPSPAP